MWIHVFGLYGIHWGFSSKMQVSCKTKVSDENHLGVCVHVSYGLSYCVLIGKRWQFEHMEALISQTCCATQVVVIIIINEDAVSPSQGIMTNH